MKKKTQIDAVIEVMEQNRGYATLLELYNKVLAVEGIIAITKDY